MIERHRADDVGLSAESDDSDSVVRPSLNEFARDFPHRIEAGRLFATDGEVFRQHRAGNIEHEHDVDAARFYLGQAFPELRPGNRDDEGDKREPNQSAQKSARSIGAAFSNRTKRRSCRKDDRRPRADFSAQ